VVRALLDVDPLDVAAVLGLVVGTSLPPLNVDQRTVLYCVPLPVSFTPWPMFSVPVAYSTTLWSAPLSSLTSWIVLREPVMRRNVLYELA
jgi:hypothetical protein